MGVETPWEDGFVLEHVALSGEDEEIRVKSLRTVTVKAPVGDAGTIAEVSDGLLPLIVVCMVCKHGMKSQHVLTGVGQFLGIVWWNCHFIPVVCDELFHTNSELGKTI